MTRRTTWETLSEGTAKLRAALAAQPILERRESGEHLRCRVGDAVLTAGAFNALPFDAIVHTVPPFWPRGVNDGEHSEAHAEWAAALLCHNGRGGLRGGHGVIDRPCPTNLHATWSSLSVRSQGVRVRRRCNLAAMGCQG